jgi:hypothetical protein
LQEAEIHSLKMQILTNVMSNCKVSNLIFHESGI